MNGGGSSSSSSSGNNTNHTNNTNNTTTNTNTTTTTTNNNNNNNNPINNNNNNGAFNPINNAPPWQDIVALQELVQKMPGPTRAQLSVLSDALNDVGHALPRQMVTGPGEWAE